MELSLVLGAAAVVAAVGVLWWGVSARPSAAHGNLVAGLPDAAPEAPPLVELARRTGTWLRRRIPNPLVDGLEVNLVQAGHPGGLDLARILAIKAVLGLMGVFFLVVMGHPWWGLAVGAVLFFAPDYWVLSVRDERQTAIRRDAADVIDQLTVCVEAGLGFDAALARVAGTTTGPLTDELKHTLTDIRAGVPRSQALRAFADRVPLPEIRQLVNSLMQAQKHGVSMSESLRVQSAEMRMKKTQRTEEKAAKLGVKLVFPIVLCFMPVFIIVTLVPSIIIIARSL